MRIAIKPEAITNARKALGDISRDELAKRIGVDRVTAYRVDAGLTDPSPKFIAGLMVATGKRFDAWFEIVQDVA